MGQEVFNPLGGLSRLADLESRSISAENPTGGKGRGGMAEEGTGAFAAREPTLVRRQAEEVHPATCV